MKLLAVTGLGGVIGQRFLQYLPPDYSVLDLYHTHPLPAAKNIVSQKIDLLDASTLSPIFDTYHPSVIIHLAAITHIDTCEEEKGNSQGNVWKLNVNATEALAKLAKNNGIKFIFMSTECVFNGLKEAKEDTPTNPINWYGKTKAEAEKIVQTIDKNFTILRSVVAYHQHDRLQTIYGKVRALLLDGHEVEMVSDHFFSPTHTDDIVRALFAIVPLSGGRVFHVAPAESITPYDFGVAVAKQLNIDKAKIIPRTGIDFFGKERDARRLHHAVLNTKKSSQALGFRAKTVYEVLGIHV